MISVNQAIEILKGKTSLLQPVKLHLTKSAGLVLAEDVFAACSVPGFDQAAMDGYAFDFDVLSKSIEFNVAQKIAAGDTNEKLATSQDAVRIFTGAAIPPGTNTVVMQEKVEVLNDRINILDKELKKGTNVRLKGSEINEGELALKKGSFLSPAAIGFLAGVGVTEVLVYPKPVVHIIVTGKEIIQPGRPLEDGKVYDTNSHLLKSALNQLHISNVTVQFVADDLQDTIRAISKALEKADLILLTGGVSVGDYDFVIEATKACDVEQLFHKVKQRPGKPIYAGIKNKTIVLGLPGNPASVLTCFYQYVVMSIECMTGQQNIIPKKWMPLTTAFQKKVPFTQFLKAHHDKEKVAPLAAQESYRLSSFSAANCLIVLPEEKMNFEAGEPVETLILPYL